MLLCLPQRLGADHVELHLPAAQVEIGADEVGPLGHARRRLKCRRAHLHIEDGSVYQVYMLQVGYRLYRSCGAIHVAALGRRAGIGERHHGLAPVRGGTAEKPVGDMGRHRRYGGSVALTGQGLVLAQLLDCDIETILGDIIHVRVVVAVLGRV